MEALLHFYNTYSIVIDLMGINAILGLSIYITLSCAMLSVANAGFMGIAAYTSAQLTMQFGWPFWPAIISGALVGLIVSIPLGLPLLRLHGIFLAIATVGFVEIMRIVEVLNIHNSTNGATGLSVRQETTLLDILLVLLFLIYFFWILTRSRFGRALAAIREDENAALTMGINVPLYKMLAFAIGAFIAGLAGGLKAHESNFISPDNFNFHLAVTILVFAVVGGTTRFWGPILGAFLITLLPELLRFSEDYRTAFNGLILLLVIIFLPDGLLTVALGFPRRRLFSFLHRNSPDADVEVAPDKYGEQGKNGKGR